MKDEKIKEYILCAAIWIQSDEVFSHQPKNVGSGLVVCGRRHHNCFLTYSKSENKVTEDIGNRKVIQGFLTNTDRFVDRKEGAQIAYQSEQTKELCSPLFSEDLY